MIQATREGPDAGDEPKRSLRLLPEKRGIYVKESNWERDYLNGKITPELLRHFSREEALRLVEYFFQTPGAETQQKGGSYSLRNLNDESRSFLGRELKGADVIEFGSKGLRQNPEFTPFEINSYRETDCDYGDDALTYLMKQPDRSAIVCSFGVLDRGVLDSFTSKDSPLERYISLLSREIYRVTPRGAITLHGTDGFSKLEEVGFVDKRVLHRTFMGDILTYRK